jgi:hypothetical protein
MASWIVLSSVRPNHGLPVGHYSNNLTVAQVPEWLGRDWPTFTEQVTLSSYLLVEYFLGNKCYVFCIHLYVQSTSLPWNSLSLIFWFSSFKTSDKEDKPYAYVLASVISTSPAVSPFIQGEKKSDLLVGQFPGRISVCYCLSVTLMWHLRFAVHF